MTKQVDCGVVVNTHGIRGEVKIKSFLDDGAFEGLKQVYIGGLPYSLLSTRGHKGFVLAFLEGVDSVDKAMALKNQDIKADRDSFALPEGHYFYGDIYGFEVYDHRTRRPVGRLAEVRESPAGMLYVIEDVGRTFMVPAVEAFKRGVFFDRKTLEIETIYGMLPDEN